MAGMESRLALCYFFFLSFLAILEGLESWVEVSMEALALKFVPAIIIHHSLSLDFVCGGVHRSISSGDSLVSLLYIRAWS